MATASAYQAFKELPPEERTRRIQAATGAKPKTPTPTYNTSGVSATTAGATAKPMGSMPPSMPAQGSQASHQGFINNPNSGFGGMSSYTANQQNRFNDASAQGNQEMLGKLNADASRVGYSFQPYSAPQTAQVSMPQQTAQPSIMTPSTSSDLQQEATANINKQRVGIEQGVNKFIAGLTAGYDYSKQNTQDSRILQDVTRTQVAQPFANLGRTSFNEGLIGRQRTMEDGATDRQFNNELTAVQQQLLDFDRLAPEQQQALFQQLKRMERDYGLNLAQISGNLPEGMGRTLAAQGQDFNQGMANKQFGLDERAQNFNEGQQGFENRFNYGQATGTFSNGQQTLQNKQFQYTQGRDKVADQQWKSEFDRITEQNGIANALNWAQNSISQQNADTSADSAANSNTNAINRLAWDKDPKNPSNMDKPVEASQPEQLSDTQIKNNTFAEYTSTLDTLEPDEIRTALEQEKSNIIKELGASGYNSLYSMYFDSNGNPK